jgi:hypothetical protein
MKTLLKVLTVLFLSIAAGVTGNMLFDVSAVPITAGFIGLNIAAPYFVPAGVLSQLIFTAPGGIGVAFQFPMTFIPQFLNWNNVVPLTSIRVESQEDGVILDLNAAGIAAVNGYMNVGALPANNVLIPLSNGKIAGRNVTVSGVTSAAGAVPFFASSDTKGDAILLWTNAQILALNPTEFKNFTAIFAPTMAAGDYVDVTFRDGHVQSFQAQELAALAAKYQAVAAIALNNINAYIHRAEFVCAAATPAYMCSVKKIV